MENILKFLHKFNLECSCTIVAIIRNSHLNDPRLQSKRAGVEKAVQQLKETIDRHTEKVPEHVRQANCNKLTSLTDELGTIDTAIANFKKLTEN